MRKTILSIIGILFIALSIFISKTLIDNKTKPKPVAKKIVKTVFTDTIQNTTVPIVIQGNGSLKAKERIELYSEVQGVLKKGTHLFKTGQTYKKGNVLIKADDVEYYASVQSAKSNLYNIIASIMPDLRLDFPEIYPKWKKYLDNFNIESSTPSLPKIESEKENYFITGREIVKEYYNVKNLEQRLSKYSIKAPFNGVLTEALVTEGTLVRSGQKLGEFINPSIFEMEVSISKSYASILKTGKQVALTNLEKTEDYTGTITRVNGSINTATQTIAVFIEVENNNLKEGLYLDANINAKSIDNAIEIDRNLLLESHEIFIIKDGMLNLMPVKPVHFSDTTVILQNVPNGTVILKSPIPGAYAGMLVTPISK
ncbi:efflux transporter periplasmic adaptor subunit [Wenyingzhuangia fucanilytica]|uniref:Efflux transporter periplasmic adaptor subunit n=1 Tax=Wenyingzhuangia fucanilytica TaxID=1790137 RepID=A0A1B1Y4L5_9FLAO|nr:HlyD family efflux transporter periplasmic adaptor subunit [Wenyingzhuangia fucanilytica]ANW95721.1 efflux transporter periplasmic adaptor subunit [Wenyingzhuangia fucanilytica]